MDVFSFATTQGLPAVIPLLSAVVGLIGTTLVNAIKVVVGIVQTLLPIAEPVIMGIIGLIKGISTFDPKKGARLATYAARCVENAMHPPGRYFPLRSAKRDRCASSDPVF